MRANAHMRSRLAPWLWVGLLTLCIEGIVRIFHIPEYLFPLPSSVVIEIFDKAHLILPHLGLTMLEALLGFFLGNLIALTCGILFSQVQSLRQGLLPLFVGIQAVPIVAIAPFVIIWFGPGISGKAVLAALICYFPATVISTEGFANVNRDALAYLTSIGASKWKIFWSLRFPSAVPSIVAAFQVSVTLCAIGAIVAELSGANQGVGYLILRASYEFQTRMLFAVMVLTSIATVGLFFIVKSLGDRYARIYKFSYAAPVE